MPSIPPHAPGDGTLGGVELEIPEVDPPTAIELDREHHLRLTWPDGRVTTFALETLRVRCPCATCRGRREQRLPVYPGPHAPQPLRAVDAELVGNWGLLIRWNDGHDTGIYAWSILAGWSAGPEGG
jgi:DUF971 family protein